MKPYNTSKHFGKAVIKYSKYLVIGKGSTYNDGCYFNARFGIVIGENTLIGPYVLIQTSNHVIKNINIEQNANDVDSWCKGDSNKRVIGQKIIIGSDVWIGANTTILSGSIIPDKCVIGAGTLITAKNSRSISRGDIIVNDTKVRILGNREDYE